MSNTQNNLERGEGTEDRAIALYYSTGTPFIPTPPLNLIVSVSLTHDCTVPFWVLVTSLLSQPRLGSLKILRLRKSVDVHCNIATCAKKGYDCFIVVSCN